MNIPKVYGCDYYQRINNILQGVKSTGETIPLVKFKQWFPDLKECTQEHLNYMAKYMKMNPKLYKIMEPQAPKNNVQLSIFD
jgi:regulator of sigma D